MEHKRTVLLIAHKEGKTPCKDAEGGSGKGIQENEGTL